ncbi:MAG TPA: hypothetical protein VFA07_19080 [Chthonomonadaceae bacterium]|nr:hypothetical protein [Chthonomonadaceae bacterium]
MPQYQEQKKGQVRIRVLPKDATNAYLFLMQYSGGRLQVLPNEVYVIDESLLPLLREQRIGFEILDQKRAPSGELPTAE